MPPTWVLSRVLLVWLIAIAAMDFLGRKVRNWMVLLGLALGFAGLFGGVLPFGEEPWSGLVGMALAFAALLPFYALRWMGAGDVKFAAVIGLWFGVSPFLLLIWLGGNLLAGLHGALLVSWRWWWSRQVAAPADPARPQSPRSIPYAGYLALATIWLLLNTDPALST